MPDFSVHLTNYLFFISAKMCDNDEAGCSKRISAEGELRPPNKQLTFWEAAQRLEDDEEYHPSESEDDEMEDAEEEAEGTTDDETTDGGEGTGSGGNPPKKKKKTKERRPNTVGTVREEITEVSPSGVPLEPDLVVRGYGGQGAAITQTTISINTENLRHKDNGHLRTLLFEKLHARYKFPAKYQNTNYHGNEVNKSALTKMSTALASWRTRIKKKIYKEGKSLEEIQKIDPQITEDQFREFKERCESERALANSNRGKVLQAMNIGHHHLGSGGYRTAEAKWNKEEEEYRSKGIENFFAKFKPGKVRNFIRAHYHVDPKTKQLTADLAVKEFEEIVVSNLITTDQLDCNLIDDLNHSLLLLLQEDEIVASHGSQGSSS